MSEINEARLIMRSEEISLERATQNRNYEISHAKQRIIAAQTEFDFLESSQLELKRDFCEVVYPGHPDYEKATPYINAMYPGELKWIGK
jgi:hypothetical protein